MWVVQDKLLLSFLRLKEPPFFVGPPEKISKNQSQVGTSTILSNLVPSYQSICNGCFDYQQKCWFSISQRHVPIVKHKCRCSPWFFQNCKPQQPRENSHQVAMFAQPGCSVAALAQVRKMKRNHPTVDCLHWRIKGPASGVCSVIVYRTSFMWV